MQRRNEYQDIIAVLSELGGSKPVESGTAIGVFAVLVIQYAKRKYFVQRQP